MIEIWAPKYSTNEALIGSHHVHKGQNEIVFTKAKHLKGKVFVMDGEQIKNYPQQANGRGIVYRVPMGDLKEKES